MKFTKEQIKTYAEPTFEVSSEKSVEYFDVHEEEKSIECAVKRWMMRERVLYWSRVWTDEDGDVLAEDYLNFK